MTPHRALPPCSDPTPRHPAIPSPNLPGLGNPSLPRLLLKENPSFFSNPRPSLNSHWDSVPRPHLPLPSPSVSSSSSMQAPVNSLGPPGDPYTVWGAQSNTMG